MILETQRLFLREMEQGDFPALCRVLQNPRVMTAYEHPFSDQEVQEWLDRQMGRYVQDGFGLWMMVQKDSGEAIGQCGITMQPWGERMVPEIGYLLEEAYWHQGYAIEAASACKRYAFEQLGMEEVYSIIRDNNYPSQKVAQRNGMTVCGTQWKWYYGMEMLHLVYRVHRESGMEET